MIGGISSKDHDCGCKQLRVLVIGFAAEAVKTIERRGLRVLRAILIRSKLLIV